MKFLKLLLLSSITHLVQAELIDDLMEIVLHHPRSKQLLKRAIEKDEKNHSGQDENPGHLRLVPLEHKKSGEGSFYLPHHQHHPFPVKLSYGHTGWRGGKRRATELNSLLDSIIVEEKTDDSKGEHKDSLQNLLSLKRAEESNEDGSLKLTLASQRDEDKNENNNPPESFPWARDDVEGKNDDPPGNVPWTRDEIMSKKEGPPSIPWKKDENKNINDNPPGNLPWTKNDVEDEITKGKKLYKRLMDDINDYIIMKNKVKGRKNTANDASSDILARLFS